MVYMIYTNRQTLVNKSPRYMLAQTGHTIVTPCNRP